MDRENDISTGIDVHENLYGTPTMRDPGSIHPGAGRAGGSGALGSLARMHEDAYFQQVEKDQIASLRRKLGVVTELPEAPRIATPAVEATSEEARSRFGQVLSWLRIK